jgi:FAD/FMN-containing dehydrogenase
MVDDLDQLTVGHYIGEADIVHHPIRHQRSFTPEHWRRLQQVRRRYDPQGRFHGPFADGEAG